VARKFLKLDTLFYSFTSKNFNLCKQSGHQWKTFIFGQSVTGGYYPVLICLLLLWKVDKGSIHGKI
jgi:hypothetical protein